MPGAGSLAPVRPSLADGTVAKMTNMSLATPTRRKDEVLTPETLRR